MDTIFGAACKELWGEQVSFVVRRKNSVELPAEIKAWLRMAGQEKPSNSDVTPK